MKWFDWRKTCRETQQTLRIQAVLLVTEADEAPKDVIHFLGITPSRLYDWLAKYRKGGIKALKSRPRPGRAPKLTRAQAKWVRKVVLESSPEAFGFETKLWMRKILVHVIEKRFGVRLSEWTVGRLLRRLRVSYEKPRKRAYQQDPALSRW
jgi:transposase